jgi:transposase
MKLSLSTVFFACTLTFIPYSFGIRSMCKTIGDVETNMAYRWFLDYGFHDKVPPTPCSG